MTWSHYDDWQRSSHSWLSLLIHLGNPPGVTQLMCAGRDYNLSNLWAGDSTGDQLIEHPPVNPSLQLLLCQGQLTIWTVPSNGLDFIPVKTWKAHSSCVRGLINTWRNALSIADDGLLLIHDLTTFGMNYLNIYCWVNGMAGVIPIISDRWTWSMLIGQVQRSTSSRVVLKIGEYFFRQHLHDIFQLIDFHRFGHLNYLAKTFHANWKPEKNFSSFPFIWNQFHSNDILQIYTLTNL